MMIDSLMSWISDWGIFVPVICVLLMSDKKQVLRAAVALVLAFFLTDVLKIVVARPRPEEAVNGWFFNTPADVYSFPSKHASISFALATSTIPHKRALGLIAGAFAVLISISRIYLGAHYWTDVIAGAILGIAISYATEKLAVYFERSSKRKRR